MLNLPTGVALDSAGNVYIADFQNNRVRKVDASGTITTVAGTGSPFYGGDGGSPIAAGVSTEEVAVDAAGNLYIADWNNMRVREIH